MVSNLVSALDLDDLPRLKQLLTRFEWIGGVLDYVPLKCSNTPTRVDHCRAAIMAMQWIDQAHERRANELATEEFPVERFFRVTWDESKLVGQPITLEEFWGSDDASAKRLGPTSWTLPNVDGYKTAFFLPPYGIRGSESDNQELFNAINAAILGSHPDDCTIYSWSTDWSNYFDAGHEWWGAFFWTVNCPETQLLTAIGASTTD